MTRDDIIHMAREAARSDNSRLLGCGLDDLARFAAVVAAAEREACAKLCEEWGAWNNVAADCAAAIRARGQA